MIRIKAMYSIVSTPSRKKGQKASPLQNQRGKTANRMATPVCIVADDTGKRNKHNKKAAGNPAAFRFLSELLRVYKGQGITARCARELRPGSAWPWRAAILWRPTKTKEVYLGFSAPA